MPGRPLLPSAPLTLVPSRPSVPFPPQTTRSPFARFHIHLLKQGTHARTHTHSLSLRCPSRHTIPVALLCRRLQLVVGFSDDRPSSIIHHPSPIAHRPSPIVTPGHPPDRLHRIASIPVCSLHHRSSVPDRRHAALPPLPFNPPIARHDLLSASLSTALSRWRRHRSIASLLVPGRPRSASAGWLIFPVTTTPLSCPRRPPVPPVPCSVAHRREEYHRSPRRPHLRPRPLLAARRFSCLPPIPILLTPQHTSHPYPYPASHRCSTRAPYRGLGPSLPHRPFRHICPSFPPGSPPW